MAKKTALTFKIKSTSNLISFLKKFSSVEKTLLLEITSENLIAKSNTPDRASVKYSRISLTEVLEAKNEMPSDLLKIGIMDINKFCNIFKHFNETDEIFLDVIYDRIGDDFIGVEMQIYTSNLRITFTCQDIALLTYISQDALKRIIKSVADEKIVEFPFPKEIFSKISSLCNIDGSEDHVRVKVTSEGKVLLKSKSFEYHLLDVPAGNEVELTFKNKQFDYIDQEISAFHLSNNKMLVKSTESETMIILGKQE